MPDNDAQIYNINPSEDTIVVVPRTLDYIFDRDREGGDVFGILFQDKRVGPMMLTLNASMTQHITEHLTAMLGRREQLRREYDERNQ